MEGIFSLVVGDKIPGEPPTIFSSPNLELRVDRNTAGAIANKTMSDSVGNVKLTDWCHLTGQEFNCSTEETVDMKVRPYSKRRLLLLLWLLLRVLLRTPILQRIMTRKSSFSPSCSHSLSVWHLVAPSVYKLSCKIFMSKGKIQRSTKEQASS